MTFLEKAKEINTHITDEETLIKGACPCHFGLEDEFDCTSTGGKTCVECWNREIPNTDKSILLSIGENYESSVVKKIKEQEEKMVKDIVSECLNNKEPHFSNPVIEKAYNTGLNDAWELMKKLYLEIPHGIVGDIFDTDEPTEIIEHYTPQEALAKLKAYEEAQEIKVGDVVTNEERNVEILVTEIDDYERTFNGVKVTPTDELGNLGGVYTVMLMCKFKKTGKHIDIKSILEQIGE